ncbi:hypothetical protein [Intestinibacter sp.]
MINKKYLKQLILYQWGSLKGLATALGMSERCIYRWFDKEETNIPIQKLELVLGKIEIDIDKEKLFIL